jgi:hypothetical protein
LRNVGPCSARARAPLGRCRGHGGVLCPRPDLR